VGVWRTVDGEILRRWLAGHPLRGLGGAACVDPTWVGGASILDGNLPCDYSTLLHLDIRVFTGRFRG